MPALRILTAVVLILLVLALLFKATPPVFCIITGIVMLIASFEWAGLMGVRRWPGRLLYVLLMLILGIAVPYAFPVVVSSFVGAGWWVIAALLVFIYPLASRVWGQSKILRGMMGICVLIPAWLSINYIRNTEAGVYRLLFLLILIWVADSSAYFVGKAWGKHKLIPQVSPGKSWEGLVAAVVGGIIYTTIVLWASRISYTHWLSAYIISTITLLFSILGDLFESMLKRVQGLKDSSQILPGHGGLLDRIDSLTAAAPLFIVSSMWLYKLN